MDVFGPKAARYVADMRPTHAVSTKVMTGSHKTAPSAGTANFTTCLKVNAGKSISFSFLPFWTTSDDVPAIGLGDFCPDPIIFGLFGSLVEESVVSLPLFRALLFRGCLPIAPCPLGCKPPASFDLSPTRIASATSIGLFCFCFCC